MPFSRRPFAAVAAAGPGEAETVADVLAFVRAIELRPGRLITDVLAGGFRSTFRGGGVEFADVREYVEGDDPRVVDWNVTARLGRPFVKRFVEERERTLVFVQDLGVGLAAGTGAWSSRSAGARLLACLGLMAIENHDRVGLVAGDGRTDRLVLPKKGAGHVLRILRDVVERPVATGAGDLEALLRHVAARFRRRTVVFVVSDFAGEVPLPTLAVLAHHHDVVAVRTIPREMIAPPPLLLRTCDPIDGRIEVVDFAAPAVRAAWQRRVQAWRAARDEQFARTGVDCIDVEVPAEPDRDAVAQPLLRFFRRRQLREARR